jgi:hypothetical protein
VPISGLGGSASVDSAASLVSALSGTYLAKSKLSWVFPEDYGAVSDAGTTDNTAALQAWIDGTARGRGIYGWMGPNRQYGFTGQLVIPADAHIFGSGAQPGSSNEGGSELQWYGASGTDAVVTSLTSETDWSRGVISDLRIVNKATSNTAGWGLHVRNPQNTALLNNVTVKDFPDGGCLVEETKTSGTVGTTPGVFFIDRCFFIGGKTPLKIRNGSQPVCIDRSAIDTDDNTDTAGVLVAAGPVSGTGPRAPIGFRGTKVEIATTTATDVPGWQITADAPVHFDTCQVQRNAGLGTRGGIEHTNSTRKWGRITLTNHSTWDMAYALRLLSASFDLANPGTTAPWATNFDWMKGDALALTYAHTALIPSMSSVAVPLAGLSFNAGMPLPSPGVITGLSVSSSASVTAGSCR